jgi:hypothetical protein
MNNSSTTTALVATGEAGSVALPDLAAQINEHHRAAERAVNEALRHALEAGRLLIEAKGLVAHGGWLPWLRENFEGSGRTARIYMMVARRWPELQANRQRAADLSLRGAVKLLTGPKADTPDGADAQKKRWTRRTRALRRRLEAAEAMEPGEAKLRALKAIRDDGLKIVLEAQEFTRRAERQLGQLLSGSDLPMLRPDTKVEAVDEAGNYMEIIPVPGQPDCYRMSSIDMQKNEIVYDRRGGRYGDRPEYLATALRVHGFRPFGGWHFSAWDGSPPWFESLEAAAE